MVIAPPVKEVNEMTSREAGVKTRQILDRFGAVVRTGYRESKELSLEFLRGCFPPKPKAETKI